MIATFSLWIPWNVLEMSASCCRLVTLPSEPFDQELLLTAPERSDHCVRACSFLSRFTRVCNIPAWDAGLKGFCFIFLKLKLGFARVPAENKNKRKPESNPKTSESQQNRSFVSSPADFNILKSSQEISSTEPLGETGLGVLHRMILAVGGVVVGVGVGGSLWSPDYSGLMAYCVSFLHYDTSAYGCRKCLVPNEILYWIQFGSFSTCSGEPWLRGTRSSAWMFHPLLQLRALRQGEQRGDSVAGK